MIRHESGNTLAMVSQSWSFVALSGDRVIHLSWYPDSRQVHGTRQLADDHSPLPPNQKSLSIFTIYTRNRLYLNLDKLPILKTLHCVQTSQHINRISIFSVSYLIPPSSKILVKFLFFFVIFHGRFAWHWSDTLLTSSGSEFGDDTTMILLVPLFFNSVLGWRIGSR